MSESVRIILYGSLCNARKTHPSPSQQLLQVTEATPLEDVIRQLNIQHDKVQLIMLNHRAVLKSTIVEPGDLLALFTSEYPIFADWNDFRY